MARRFELNTLILNLAHIHLVFSDDGLKAHLGSVGTASSFPMYPGTPKYATAAAAGAGASLNALDSSPGSFSPRSSHSSTPSLPDLDEVTTLRLETFGPYRKRIRMAKMMLTWTRNGEKVYNWPCHADNQIYTPYELPQAFETLCLELPECPCATQETDPDTRHYYHIWVVQTGQYRGKVAAACAQKWQGCGTWNFISDNPGLPVEVYAARPDTETGPVMLGLPEFDRYGLLRSSQILSTSCTSLPSPIKPPPPYHQYHRQRRGGFSGVVKQSKRDSGIKMKAQIPTASADDPFIVSPHLGTPSTASSALSIPDLPLPLHSSLPLHSMTPSTSMFTIPDLPLPSHSSQYPASKGPTVPASSLDMPPSNQLAAFHTTTNSILATSRHPCTTVIQELYRLPHVPKET
ncbi:hypothetical protein JB92DRAFT_3110966 [Gautieria morchelliformis]|nr:hypothetical protein JB92DRAFT_3110966 [Gautieria morchelliformis]